MKYDCKPTLPPDIDHHSYTPSYTYEPYISTTSWDDHKQKNKEKECSEKPGIPFIIIILLSLMGPPGWFILLWWAILS
jgi:hypothetical protein